MKFTVISKQEVRTIEAGTLLFAVQEAERTRENCDVILAVARVKEDT